MAGHGDVQGYLHRHRIGPLFEDLMAKLVSDQPDEPMSYLVGVLQIKADKKGERAKRATSSVWTYKSRPRSPEPMSKTFPFSAAAAWASTEGFAVAKEKGTYDKPWQTNQVRKSKIRSVSPTRKSGGKPDWDASKVSQLEDIWGDTKVVTRGKTSGKPARSPSPTKTGASAWATEEDLTYYSHGYRGPRRSRVEADPLAGEFCLSKPEATEKPRKSKTSYGKMKNPQYDSQRHKKELQKKILAAKQTQQDSGYEDEKDSTPDGAIELMEDADELLREGARNVKRSGVKISRSQRQQMHSGAPPVRISVCAHCAKVMTGGVPSEPANQPRELPDYEFDTARDFSNAIPSARTESPGPFDYDDDEFESVSQVTGPRRVPAWQQSDDATTPRKGAHMFSSSMAPSKGRPMYSSSKQSGGKNTRFETTKSLRTDELASGSGPDVDLRKTWSPGMAADSEDKKQSKVESKEALDTARTEQTEATTVDTARTDKTTDKTIKDDEASPTARASTLGGEGGWQVNDYDSDSSATFVVGPSKGKGKQKQYQNRAY